MSRNLLKKFCAKCSCCCWIEFNSHKDDRFKGVHTHIHIYLGHSDLKSFKKNQSPEARAAKMGFCHRKGLILKGGGRLHHNGPITRKGSTTSEDRRAVVLKERLR